LVLGEYVTPKIESIAQTQKDIAQGKGTTVSAKGDRGYWHREGNNFMHFQAIEPNGVLHKLRIYGFDDDKNLKTVTYADRALYQRKHWVLESVEISTYEGDHITKSSVKSHRWSSGLTPEALSLVVVLPNDMSISGLYNYATYLQDQGLDADRYLLSFWKKMLQPLSVMMLVLVGISFIFGSARSSSMGARIFKGIVVGLLYRYGEEILGPLSIVAGIAPVFASLIPALICGVFATIMLRRAA
jgi:lipopolysaccharide export system permease protein